MMEIRQRALLDLLGEPGVRFLIPRFQRAYSWNARQCDELWDDVMRVGAVKGGGHFMGMLLYTVDPQGWDGVERLDIIEG